MEEAFELTGFTYPFSFLDSDHIHMDALQTC